MSFFDFSAGESARYDQLRAEVRDGVEYIIRQRVEREGITRDEALWSYAIDMSALVRLMIPCLDPRARIALMLGALGGLLNRARGDT